MLTCDGVGVIFAGVAALAEVNFSVNSGEAVGLIGPNGSGKTTLVNVISGYYRPSSGKVEFEGTAIEGKSPQYIRSRGISRVFQNIRLYSEMTVLENMQLGMFGEMSGSSGVLRATVSGIFGRRDTRATARDRDRALQMLRDSGLAGLTNRLVGELSYGQRKEIELLRAMAIPPRFLLLDEPTSGVSDKDAEFFKERILDWKSEFGFGLIVVEHRLGWLFDVATKVIVLNSGRIIATGSPDDISANAEVRRAYVGG